MNKSKFSHGGDIWQVSEKYKIPPDKILDFSTNVNPWGKFSGVVDVIKKNIREIFHYPDPECRKLIFKLSEFLKLERENIVVGNGATEIIYLLMMSLRPYQVVIPVPTFTEYERALRLSGGKAKFLFLKEKSDFTLDVDELIKKVKDSQMVIICNPNNPTGRVLDQSKMQKIVDKAEKMGKFVVVDESFIDFCPQESIINSIKKHQNLFILRSFTKFFSIAGLRLGYGIGSKEVIAKIKSVKLPWMVNSLAEIAGVAILENMEKFKELRQRIEKERAFLYKNLSKINAVKPYPSITNFILVRIKASFSSSHLANEMAKRGILIRDCSNFTGLSDRFFRIAVRKREENKKLIFNLKQILGANFDY